MCFEFDLSLAAKSHVPEVCVIKILVLSCDTFFSPILQELRVALIVHKAAIRFSDGMEP